MRSVKQAQEMPVFRQKFWLVEKASCLQKLLTSSADSVVLASHGILGSLFYFGATFGTKLKPFKLAAVVIARPPASAATIPKVSCF